MAEPDQLLELADRRGGWARCGLWWGLPSSAGPGSATAATGRIGRLAASGPEIAAVLLERACGELHRRGCSEVLAPLDGDTWQAYRVLEPGQDGGEGFAGEPDLDPCWGSWLMEAGFAVCDRYVSSRCGDLQRHRAPAGLPASVKLLSAEQLATNTPATDRLPTDTLVASVHRLILQGFRRQPLFTPIGLEAFQQHWQAWLPRLDPRLSLLAFDGDELVGLLLAHPDRSPGQRVVVRTLVVRPGRRWAGLGRRLLESCHGRAAALGHHGVIHALMHDPGASLALSRAYAQPFRSHVLLRRQLSQSPEPEPGARAS